MSRNGTADLSCLSALSRDHSEERIARLAEVAAAIRNGQYGVDAHALSERLVEEHLAAELEPRSLDVVGAIYDGDGFEIEAPVG